jgi:DNA-binding MarR family transcriptional regulator
MSNRNELIGQVRAAMRRLTTEIDGLDECASNHFGVNRTDLRVIDTLRSRGPLTASELARSVGLTSGGLSIALERLERIGYIRRSPHPDDRRSVLVETTEEIPPLEQQVFARLGKRMNHLLRGYTEEQLATIQHYLEGAAAATADSVHELTSDNKDKADTDGNS